MNLTGVIFWLSIGCNWAVTMAMMWLAWKNYQSFRKWRRLHLLYIDICLRAWACRLFATRLVLPGEITIRGTHITYEE